MLFAHPYVVFSLLPAIFALRVAAGKLRVASAQALAVRRLADTAALTRDLRMKTMKSTAVIAAFALTLPVLAACGSSPTDRALSGGAIGAGVGAVGGAMLGAPVKGAAIGAAAGAGVGALTDKKQIDLGKPAWR